MSLLDKKKTVTGMQFAPLIEPDISIKAAKKHTMIATENLGDFNKVYWQWKHGYRTTYTKKFLDKCGFEPITQTTTTKFNDDQFENYMQNVDSDYDTYITRNFSSPGMVTSYLYFMQNNSGSDWSNETKKLQYNGDEWNLEYVHYRENPDPNIPDDDNYLVGTFSCVSDPAKPDMQIETSNIYKEATTLNVTYRRTTSTTEWYVYIEDINTVPQILHDEEALDITPIVPLKIGGRLVETNMDIKRIMNKLNVDGENFEETLMEVDNDGDPKINDAFLMNALPLLNPYEIYPQVYTVKEAEQLPMKILQMAIKKGLAEKNPVYEGRLDEENPEYTSYNITEELAQEFYHDHLKEQAYLARGLFRSFAYYAQNFNEDCVGHRASPFYLGMCVEDCDATNPPIQNTDENKYIPTGSHSIYLKSKAFGLDNVSIKYTFDMEVKTYNGRVRVDVNNPRTQAMFHYSGTMYGPANAKDKRGSWQTGDSTGIDLLEIKVQINETQYQVMKITNFKGAFMLPGGSKVSQIGFGSDEMRLVIPYFVEQRLKFTEYVTIHEHSFVLYAFMIKTVVVKWYKRLAGFFLSIAFCLTGVLCPLGIAMTAVLSLASTLVMEYIGEHVHNEFMQMALGLAMGALTANFTNGASLATFLMDNFLPISLQAMKLMHDKREMEKEKETAEAEAELQSIENMGDRLDNYEEMMPYTAKKPSLSAHSSFMQSHSPDAFYASIYEAPYNYEKYYAVSAVIEFRSKVENG